MQTPEELREESRICLKAAMKLTSRVARHRLARRGLEMASMAKRLEKGLAMMEKRAGQHVGVALRG